MSGITGFLIYLFIGVFVVMLPMDRKFVDELRNFEAIRKLRDIDDYFVFILVVSIITMALIWPLMLISALFRE